MKKRLLTGLQPSGQLHLGNYVGGIQPLLELQGTHELFVFVASYHALTSTRDPALLRANIHQIVVDYIAFGLDPEKCYLYLQHDVPEVTEIAWLLSCVCSKGLMDKATSFKDKTAKGLPASVGLYTYPILQAADILGVDPDEVPVGEDQRQHIEITRDLAEKFNAHYGPTFKVPEARIRADAGVLPGIDGQKMSKSYDNTIDPFLPEKALRKRVMKIVTDATPVEEAKDPGRCNVFQMYSALAGPDHERTRNLAARYRAGGYGYGQAKEALFELILEHFAPARKRREQLRDQPGYIAEVLKDGAGAARQTIQTVTTRARQAAGLDSM